MVFFFRADDIELFFELEEGGGGCFHLRFEVFELPFHEVRLSFGILTAHDVGVLDVAIGHVVGDLGGDFRVRVAITDEQQVGARGAGDGEMIEREGALVLRGTSGGGHPLAEFLDDGTDDGVRLDELDLGLEEEFGVVEGGGAADGCVLADNALGGGSVDVDGDGGFVIFGEAAGDHGGGADRDGDKE